MAKKKTDGKIRGVKNLRTGVLSPVNEKNLQVLKRRDMREVEIELQDGEYKEVGGSDETAAITNSKDLGRIGQQLLNLMHQREQLITAALKLPDGEDYLKQTGAYDGEDDKQYINPEDVQPNNAGLPRHEFTEPTVGIQDETEALAAEHADKSKPTRRKSTAKKDEGAKDIDL